MIRLPISGARASRRTTDGHDELAVADGPPGLAGALAYVAGAYAAADGAPLDASALPVGDLDLLVVIGRRDVRGDSCVAEGACGRCGAAVDVQFSLAAYAAHHSPRRPRNVTPLGPDRWQLRASGVAFRLPSAGDVLAALGCEDPRRSLLESCLGEPESGRGQGGDAESETEGTGKPVSRRDASAAERAMAALAPTLRADVAGLCPECGGDLALDVDARELCMAELRFLAGSVYDDVHLIAMAYGWSHQAILGLPSTQRRRYAELISGRNYAEMLTARDDVAIPGVPVG